MKYLFKQLKVYCVGLLIGFWITGCVSHVTGLTGWWLFGVGYVICFLSILGVYYARTLKI